MAENRSMTMAEVVAKMSTTTSSRRPLGWSLGS